VTRDVAAFLWRWAEEETGVEEPGEWLQARLALGDLPLSLAELGQGCLCVSSHAPAAYVPALHHILPQSWGGRTVKANLVLLCPNSHTATHRLLDNFVRAGGTEGVDMRHFGPYARQHALQAWEQRPETPLITSIAARPSAGWAGTDVRVITPGTAGQ
jgi:hypothetical protein